MTKRLLDADPLTGLRTWHEFDGTDTLIHYEQDVAPLLDAARAARNDTGDRLGEIVHVASIPASVQLKWLIEKGVDVLDPNHRRAVATLLDDPDWRYLKVRNIILGRG